MCGRICFWHTANAKGFLARPSPHRVRTANSAPASTMAPRSTVYAVITALVVCAARACALRVIVPPAQVECFGIAANTTDTSLVFLWMVYHGGAKDIDVKVCHAFRLRILASRLTRLSLSRLRLESRTRSAQSRLALCSGSPPLVCWRPPDSFDLLPFPARAGRLPATWLRTVRAHTGTCHTLASPSLTTSRKHSRSAPRQILDPNSRPVFHKLYEEGKGGGYFEQAAPSIVGEYSVSRVASLASLFCCHQRCRRPSHPVRPLGTHPHTSPSALAVLSVQHRHVACRQGRRLPLGFDGPRPSRGYSDRRRRSWRRTFTSFSCSRITAKTSTHASPHPSAHPHTYHSTFHRVLVHASPHTSHASTGHRHQHSPQTRSGVSGEGATPCNCPSCSRLHTVALPFAPSAHHLLDEMHRPSLVCRKATLHSLTHPIRRRQRDSERAGDHHASHRDRREHPKAAPLQKRGVRDSYAPFLPLSLDDSLRSPLHTTKPRTRSLLLCCR